MRHPPCVRRTANKLLSFFWKRALHKTSLFPVNFYTISALRAEKHITRSLLKKSPIHNKSLCGESLRHPPCVPGNKLLSVVSKKALHNTGLFVANPYAASALRAQPVAASARYSVRTFWRKSYTQQGSYQRVSMWRRPCVLPHVNTLHDTLLEN